MLSRDFWTDERLHTLVECVQEKRMPVRDNGAAHLALLAGSAAVARSRPDVPPPPRLYKTPSDRLWHMFRSSVRRDHEWISPFLLDDPYFTAAARVVLLTVIVLNQMFTEALLFDFRFPESGSGTCTASSSLSTYTTTTTN